VFEIVSLVKRNIKIYLRDPLAVFFSFLSTIILMMIYILFLGNVGGDELGALLTNNEMKFLIYSQMMAGIIVLNTLTIPLGNLGSIVTDFEQNKMDAFMVTPVKRYKIILGYYVASLLITLLLSLVFWVLAVIVLGLVTGIFFSFKIVITIIPIILLFVLISTSFMILLTTFIKSINAFGAVSGIFGSLIGFVSGIYIPLSSESPQFLRSVSSIIPFSHMTIWVKGILLEPSYQTILDKTNGNQAVVDSVKDGFGAGELGLLGLDISLPILIVGAALLSIVLLIYSSYRLNKRIKI
jgi:multidrug/hemolysin transport system permease protein